MSTDLHNTTDAAIWAREFCKRWPVALCQIEGKEGAEGGAEFEAVMIGWFANAIMAGVDSESRKYAARIVELEASCHRLTEERNRALGWRDHDKERAELAEAERDALRAEVERLRDALEGLVGPHWKDAWEGATHE